MNLSSPLIVNMYYLATVYCGQNNIVVFFLIISSGDTALRATVGETKSGKRNEKALKVAIESTIKKSPIIVISFSQLLVSILCRLLSLTQYIFCFVAAAGGSTVLGLFKFSNISQGIFLYLYLFDISKKYNMIYR